MVHTLCLEHNWLQDGMLGVSPLPTLMFSDSQAFSLAPTKSTSCSTRMWPPSHLPVRNRYSAMPTLTPGRAEFWRGCDWVQRAWILVTCPLILCISCETRWANKVSREERVVANTLWWKNSPSSPPVPAPSPCALLLVPATCPFMGCASLTYPGLGTLVSRVPTTQRT